MSERKQCQAPGLEHLGLGRTQADRGPSQRQSGAGLPSSLRTWERVRGGLLAAHTRVRCFSGSGKRRPLLGLPQGDGSLGPRDEVWGPMSCPRPGPEKAETALPGKQRPVGRLPERWPPLLPLPASQHLGLRQRRRSRWDAGGHGGRVWEEG